MLNLIKKQLNRSVTEKGAVGYKSTGHALLDLNYSVSSLRNASPDEILTLFELAFAEDKEYAVRWLFYARDVRYGLGERRLFRVCYRRLAELDFSVFKENLYLISEFGRWDDIVSLLDINKEADDYIIGLIQEQLNDDLYNVRMNKPVSLLAKWLPSENASSKETKRLAKRVRTCLGLSAKDYRQMLSRLRRHSNVLEVQLCNNEWENVDYERVPSLANLKYRNAFLRHDESRRREYLSQLQKGNARMNMSVATPVDIVSRYTTTGWSMSIKEFDPTLEEAWKHLKNINIKDTLVVADGSGSMTVKVGKSTTALDVANSLAIYTSEHNSGVYKNKYITFSNTPQFVEFSEASSLRNKLAIALNHCEVSNTNIYAVFELILDVAVQNRITRGEMIKNILIISDMEFDNAQRGWDNPQGINAPLFEQIRQMYHSNGYDLPKLIFWNVNSRTKTIPVIENDLGVILVSGFSQNVLRMVMSNEYDPYKALLETLDKPRYQQIHS